MTYVDERVVELRFDNKQFEQETAKSMNTLDKLKEKLQFKNASAGAEQLQKAVANVNVNPIIQGIGTIETKMSALSIAGKRVIENLVDWAMSGVHKVSHALQTPINQIINGGKARAQNIEQAKFQLEGLGVAWSDIEEDISYGVQDTAYGLDAAAKVASQLVASQVQLGDEMKHSLLGISGVAAMTNSSYEDIGRIYTTVAGNGRLMGDQLLQLSSRGINAAATLGKALDKSEADIRDMVSKGQISFRMFSDAMFEAFGTHAKEANKTFSGALSNTKAALSRLGADVAAQGFNSIRDILNDIIPKLKEFKKKMKPVEDAIITMVDAIGKLVQTFVKAIDIQGIVDKIGPPIQRACEMITEFLDAFRLIKEESKIGNFTAFIEQQKGLKRLEQSANDTKDAMVDLNKVTDEQKQMARDIWEKGSYGNGEDRVRALGDDYAYVQAYLEKLIELGFDEEKLNEELAKQKEEQAKQDERDAKAAKRKETIEKLIEIFNNLKRVVSNVFESIGNVLSVAFDTFGETFSGKSALDGVVTLTDKIADFSDKIKITEDRAQKLKPVFEVLFSIFKAVGKALSFVIRGLGNAIVGFANFLKSLKTNDTFNKIKQNFIDIFNSIFGGFRSLYNKIKEKGILGKIVNGLGTFVLFITNTLSNSIGFITDIFSNIVGGISKFAGSVIGTLSDIFGYALDGIQGPIGSIMDLLMSIFDRISVSGVLKFAALFFIVKGIISIFSLLYHVFGFFKGVAEIGHSIVTFFSSLADLQEAKVRQINVEVFKTIVDSIATIIKLIIGLMVAMAIIPNAKELAWHALAIVSIITIIYGVLEILSIRLTKGTATRLGPIMINVNTQKAQLGLLFAGLAAMLSSVIYAITNVYNILTSTGYSTSAFRTATAIIVGALVSIAGIMVGIVLALNKIGKTKGMVKTSILMLSMAFSLKITLGALGKLYDICKDFTNMNRFVAIVGIVTAMYGIIMAISLVLSKYGKTGSLLGVSTLMMALALSIKTITSSIVSIIEASNEMKDFDSFRKIFESLIAMVGLIGLLIIAISGLSMLGKKMKFGPLLGLSLVILSFSALLLAVSSTFKSLSKVKDTTNVLETLLPVISTISLVMIALMVLSKYAKALPIIAISAAVLSLGLSLALISSSIKNLESVESDKLTGIVKSLGIFIAAFVAIMALLSKMTGITGGVSALALSASLIALGLSIVLLATAFKTLNKDVGIENLKSIATTLGIFAGAVIVLVGVMAMLTGPAGALSLLGLAAAFVGLGLGLYFAGKGVNYLLDAFERLVGYLKSVFGWLIDFFSSIKNAISNLFSTKGWAEKGFGDKDKADDNGVFHKDTTYTTVDENALKIWENEAKRTAAAQANVQYTTYKTSYEEELARLQEEDPVNFNPNITPFDLAESEEKRKQAMSKIAVQDADQAEENYNQALSDELEKIKNQDYSKFWDPNLGDIDAIDVGEGMNFNFDQISDAFDSDLRSSGLDMSFMDSASEMFNSSEMTNGLADIFSKNGISGGDDFIDSLTSTITDGSGDVMNATSLTMDDVISAINSKNLDVQEAAKIVPETALKTAQSYENEFYKAGVMLYEGFAEGLSDKQPKQLVVKNISDVVWNAQHALCSEAEIESPSKLFMRLGRYVTLGFAQGISSLSNAAETATEDLGEDSVSALESVIRRIFDTTMNGMDTNPRITPVLDLSQVQTGLDTLDGMFTNRSSFGLAFGNASAYNNNMAAKFAAMNQTPNGYDDTRVVDAITRLGNDISSLKESMSEMGVYIDKKTLVGAIADPMSEELDRINVSAGRGVR